MHSFLDKSPFLKLLIPVVTATIANSHVHFSKYDIALFIVLGIVFIVSSFIVRKELRYKLRWLFGFGVFIILFGLVSVSFMCRDKKTQFDFNNEHEYYVGTIINIPEEKPATMACNVVLRGSRKNKVLLYIDKSKRSRNLSPGEEIVFYCKFETFKNLGNPDDFNYERYMRIKGFAGTAYVGNADWQSTGRKIKTIYTSSQIFRKRALDFYSSLNLDKDSQAFVSALSLGYKSELSEEIKKSFRTSGSAHVLAVSGLHVGIIYFLIISIFNIFGIRKRHRAVAEIISIIILWWYAFVVGLSPSVVRAVIMFTIYGFGVLIGEKAFTWNSLAIGAFFIVIFNPYSLLDVSFQMSFGAVTAILFFKPIFDNFYLPENRLLKAVWELFIVSVCAQLGVFPIVLYYFGTYPVYFFITNLLILPLTWLIIIGLFVLLSLQTLSLFNIAFIASLKGIAVALVNGLIRFSFSVVSFIEELPLSEISGININVAQTVILILFTYLIFSWIASKRHKYLMASLVMFLMLSATITADILNKDSAKLAVMNKYNESEIVVFFNNKRFNFDVPKNGIIAHPNKSVIRLSGNDYSQYYSSKKFEADVIILSNNNRYRMDDILRCFEPKIVVFDSSVPKYRSAELAKECISRKIEFHDVKENGAFLLNF
ncbi:MAG: ComEC/Rec2 family competence protein [Fermentimonas sp.]|jgi:competence protein ComEC